MKKLSRQIQGMEELLFKTRKIARKVERWKMLYRLASEEGKMEMLREALLLSGFSIKEINKMIK